MDFNDNQVKHLEFIQSNIARMNQCSFQMKGWMLTIVSALLALYAGSINPETGNGINMFIYIAIAPVLIFWFLDSYYLQQERKFRGIYNDLINPEKCGQIKPFEMPLNKYDGCKYCLCHIMWSKTEFPLYLPVIVGLIIAGILL